MANRSLFGKAGPGDEARDAYGRWMQTLIDQGAKPYGTSGITGLSRGQVVEKVLGILDKVAPAKEDVPKVAASLMAMAGASLMKAPLDITDDAARHAANAAGFIISKVRASPAMRRLAVKVIARIRKDTNLSPEEAQELKRIVANVIADTRLHPRVSCDEAVFAQVARKAYAHCSDRLSALKHATN